MLKFLAFILGASGLWFLHTKIPVPPPVLPKISDEILLQNSPISNFEIIQNEPGVSLRIQAKTDLVWNKMHITVDRKSVV